MIIEIEKETRMELVSKILKWSTKILSLIILGLVFFIIGAHVVEGFPSEINLTNTEIQLSFAIGVLFFWALIGLNWELVEG